MIKSPYQGKDVLKWSAITKKLIAKHPLKEKEIVDTVLKSWNDIFNSKIGSFSIGKEIFPSPQIMSFFLHELVAHYLSKKHKKIYKVGIEGAEKDIHHMIDNSFSVEIKASSNPTNIFANRSYAQPHSGKGKKSKDGYYLTINFEKFNNAKKVAPKILLIRFGYLEHSDWKAQKAETGQQASLSINAYKYKLKILYQATKKVSV